MRAYEDWVIEAETRGLKISEVVYQSEIVSLQQSKQVLFQRMAATEMALSGVKTSIPIDEVIDAMDEIGQQMPCALKETAQGGLAATPTGRRIQADFL